MKDIIERIQDWYKINCNGDWEHEYGYKIETLDNPGWRIEIDLSGTSLDSLNFKRNFQNPIDENDWFFIHTRTKALKISCGPENLKNVFEIFFEELIPQYSDKDFIYEIYLPLKGLEADVWTPAKSTFVNERTLKITEIERLDPQKIKVREIEHIDFDLADLEKSELDYCVGDMIEVKLESVYDGIILTSKKKKLLPIQGYNAKA